METVKISLLDTESWKEPFMTYNMLMTNEPNSLEAEDVVQKIQCDRNDVIKECLRAGDEVDLENVWRGNHVIRPYSEEEMIERSKDGENASPCVLNEMGTWHVLPQPPSSTTCPYKNHY